MKRTAVRPALLSILVVLTGCGRKPSPASGDLPAEKDSSSGESPGSLSPIAAKIAGKVELRDADGKELCSFKPREDGSVKFYDAEGRELFKASGDNARLKVKNAEDRPLFELKRKDDKIMIKDASGETELFKFKVKGDDWSFYTPDDQRIYRIRKRDYGYALENDNGETLFRAKVKEEKVVLRDPADRTVLYSKDIARPLGLVFFRISNLSLEQQAACFLFFLQK